MPENRSFLAEGGAMGELLRVHDWANSPLGEPGSWGPSLRTSVNLMLGSAFPMFLAWGPDLGFLYNDATSALRPAERAFQVDAESDLAVASSL